MIVKFAERGRSVAHKIESNFVNTEYNQSQSIQIFRKCPTLHTITTSAKNTNPQYNLTNIVI